MAILGFFVARFGFKWTMMIGATAYFARCVILGLVFWLDPPFAGKMAMAITGQALHGFCFGCFLAAAYMYVDRIAPKDVKGSMQMFYGTFVIALGFFFGGLVSGWVGESFSDADGNIVDWTSLWMSCAVLSAICVVIFAFAFPNRLPDRE
jgi:MFS family permease